MTSGETRNVTRNEVLWHGSRHGRGDDSEFKNRNLLLKIVDEQDVDDVALMGARGVIYAIGSGGVGKVRQHLERNARRMIDHGMSIFVIAPESQIVSHIQKETETLGLPEDAAKILHGDADSLPDHKLAQLMADHDCQLGWSSALKIEYGQKTVNLQPEDERLVRRAFSDCSRIEVTRLGDGKTADTYMISATFIRKNSVILRPLPFFAKLGRRFKIEEEKQNYLEFADFHIPFHLRPNLDRKRCLAGFERGLLVGNFVERARPLWNAIEDDDAGAAIHALFDVTLAGWWAQGFRSIQGVSHGAVASALTTSIFDHSEVKPDHLKVAKTLGLKTEPKELWERLIGMTWQSYYGAPMHGDLHPDNVFVRGSDAILIDLGSVQAGPLTGDPACLETFLAFEARPGDDALVFDRWKDEIDKLFDPTAFKHPPLPRDGSESWALRWNAARKVRILGQPAQACNTEYRTSIAVYLLRRAMYETIDEVVGATDNARRAYAMVVAERLIEAIEKEAPEKAVA